MGKPQLRHLEAWALLLETDNHCSPSLLLGQKRPGREQAHFPRLMQSNSRILLRVGIIQL